MPYGVQPSGFIIKPLEVILAEIEAKQRADMNPALDQTATGPLGQLNSIFSAKSREVWEVIEAAYAAKDPDAAADASLDNVAALCPGIIRRGATKSTVVCTCNLDNGTYAIGELVAHVTGNAEARFVNTEGITVTTGPDDFDLEFESEDTGEIVALSGTLEEIAEPVTGWNSVTNAADATEGQAQESNRDFRLRREQQIQFSGATSVEGIRADVLNVDAVISTSVIENTQDIIVDGLLPHSVHVVIWDGSPGAADDAEVAEAIFQSKAAGIDTNGAVSETVTDSMNNDHIILFDRAAQKVLEIQLTGVTEDPPSDWQAASGPLITALVDFVENEIEIGGDVIYNKLLGVAMDFDWMLDITLFNIRWTGESWGTSNLTVDGDEIATLDSSDVSFV